MRKKTLPGVVLRTGPDVNLQCPQMGAQCRPMERRKITPGNRQLFQINALAGLQDRFGGLGPAAEHRRTAQAVSPMFRSKPFQRDTVLRHGEARQGALAEADGLMIQPKRSQVQPWSSAE